MPDLRQTPRARHHRAPDHAVSALSPAVETLLRRTRLVATGGLATSGSFRAASLPVLIAAVLGGGPGWTTYIVRDGDSLTGIARRHATDARALARVNGLTDADRLAAGRRLNVPVARTPASSLARRRAAASGLHPVDTSGAPALTYRVRPGDTVTGIAQRSGASMRAVLAANNLRPTGAIKAGQLLVLPALRAARQAAPAKGVDARGRVPSGARPVVHVVRTGDTVFALARRYRLSVTAVLRANRLGSAAAIRPGAKLILPGATGRPLRPGGITSAHVVRQGETVTAIARRYGVSVSSVLAINHLAGRTAIHPGRRLLVPVGSRIPGSRAAARPPTGPASSLLGRTYPEAVVRAAAANRAALAQVPVPDAAQVQDAIRATAERYGLDPALALAVGSMESGFDQRQVSPANAIGVMQVLPSSGQWAGEVIGRRLDLLEAADNITAGVVLLTVLTGRADEQTALAGYYQGLTSVRRNGMFTDTRRYVATVRTLKLRFR